jgi:hypothetical protein
LLLICWAWFVDFKQALLLNDNMDNNNTNNQVPSGEKEDRQKVDKLQKELDDLEKRAKKELENQRPSFATIETDDLNEENIQNQVTTEENGDSQSSQPDIEFISQSNDGPEIVTEPQVVQNEPMIEPVNEQPDTVQEEQGMGNPSVQDENQTPFPTQTPIQAQPVQEETQEQNQEVVDIKDTEQEPKPEKSGKLAKTLFWIAVMLFVVCLTAVGAYYVGSNNSQKIAVEPASEPITRVTPKPTATPAPSILTYTNDTYNYSFVYPDGWEVMEDLEVQEESVSVTKSGNSLTVKAGGSKAPIPSGTEKEGEDVMVDVGGLTATKTSYTGLYEVIVLPKNDSGVNAIIISYKDGNRTTEYKNIFDEILLSFKLVEEATPTPVSTPTGTPLESPSSTPEANE